MPHPATATLPSRVKPVSTWRHRLPRSCSAGGPDFRLATVPASLRKKKPDSAIDAVSGSFALKIR
jgi:hypothetical protein